MFNYNKELLLQTLQHCVLSWHTWCDIVFCVCRRSSGRWIWGRSFSSPSETSTGTRCWCWWETWARAYRWKACVGFPSVNSSCSAGLPLLQMSPRLWRRCWPHCTWVNAVITPPNLISLIPRVWIKTSILSRSEPGSPSTLLGLDRLIGDAF